MHKLHKIIVKIRRKIVQSIVNRNLPCYYKHKEKIAAIESINPAKLNLFDEAELQRLKDYNDELERKLRLNKAQLEVDAKSADKTAKWTYANSQVDFNPLNKYFGDNANAQAYSRNN